MAGFRFRLQNVLDYRTGLADRARLELGVLQAHLREAEEVLARLLASERDGLRQLGEAQTTAPLDLPHIDYLLEYGLVVAQQIVRQREVIAERQRAVDEQHQKVVALAKDAKALEKLRERQQEEYDHEENRRDLAEMGELASSLHQRARVAAP
jgi:flagellar FliJ protein